MKKVWSGIILVLIIAAIAGSRIYRKYERQKQRDEQQQQINEQFERTQKLLREKELEARNEKSKRRLDSLDSIRRAKHNENMKMLEEEIKNKKKQ
jgi:type II secretory pathway pseudopilin PulG